MRIPLLEHISPDEIRGLVAVVPDSFEGLGHVEDVLLKLQNWTLRHLISNIEYKGKASEALPQQVAHEQAVLRQQYDQYQQALRGLESSVSNQHNPESRAQLPNQQVQIQRYFLLQALFHIFYHLVTENIPDAPKVAYNVSDNNLLLESLECFRSSDSSPTERSFRSNEENLDIALSKMVALFSLPNLGAPQSPTGEFPLRPTSQRTYTLSTFLVGAIYFLCLKTTDPGILNKASGLFSHPLLKNSRDGLWDAQLAELVDGKVVNLKERIKSIPERGADESWRDGTLSRQHEGSADADEYSDVPCICVDGYVDACTAAGLGACCRLPSAALDSETRIAEQERTEFWPQSGHQQKENKRGLEGERLEDFALGFVDVD